MDATSGAPWWRGAAVYQIYVRSFFDSDGDGHGDLPGVMAKLDYLADLGIDAIWLSPVHPSPNRDWGYDVSDYEGVHPDYGTTADLEALIAAAHARGIRVLLDEVLAHTSDEHAWFRESLKGGDKAEWYVWADLKADGTAPNNWLSAFGGPAWAYQPLRRKAYHHKFLRQQPKLNWRHPDARAAALGVLDFWLARGVDGFRLDVANAYLHDADLRDNPVEEADAAWRWSAAANFQKHWMDSNLVENIEALDAVRRTVDAYPDRFVFGEFSERQSARAASPIRKRACTPATASRCCMRASSGRSSFGDISRCWRGSTPTGPAYRSATMTSPGPRAGSATLPRPWRGCCWRYCSACAGRC